MLGNTSIEKNYIGDTETFVACSPTPLKLWKGVKMAEKYLAKKVPADSSFILINYLRIF